MNNLKKYFLITAVILLANAPLFAQKWQPGYFIDAKGVKETGLIRAAPGGNGPIKNEGFIEFKEDEKANPTVLSTSDLQSFVAGKDSFVVAHALGNETWAKKEYDFVRVVVNEDVKIYATRGADGSGRRKVQVSPGIGIGTGGGYGTSYGGGLGISFGGGGGGKSSKMSYYYGSNTASMRHITNENFMDVMMDVMGDEPEVLESIRNNQYNLGNIEKLVAYYNKVKEANAKKN